jgi:RHS repeat-associated protein
LGTPQEVTDTEGNIAWSAQYKAWGEAKEVISEAARKAGINNPIRFQGQYFDEETGLHYNLFRYYDPHSGRFVSSDPIRIRGGLNFHEYASNSTNWIDPFGLCPKSYTAKDAGTISDKIISTEKYAPSPKHDPVSGWGTPMDLPNSVAQEVLDRSTLAGKQRYGLKDGKIYEFQPDNVGGWHGYPIPGTQAPPSFLRNLRDSGQISNAEYGKLLKGK